MPHRFRPAFSAAALALAATALSACSSATPELPKVSEADRIKAALDAPAGNLEDSVRQAQLLRVSGKYQDAIRHLSQLMMVASDDPRVVSEYGKTLAAMGRAHEAVNFLTRAQQLQPGDWTVYSALGVAYDQLSEQNQARAAYEHALQLKPGEPSVLSNYALSRMLAKDPQAARSLAVRAEIAGGAADPKIARDIAMIKDMAPEDPYAVTKPAPEPPRAVAHAAPPHLLPAPAPVTPVAHAPLPAPRPAVAANAAPHAAAPGSVIQASPQFLASQAASRAGGVVMQAVPVDPLAGPVRTASHAPRALTKAEPVKAEAKVEKTAQAARLSSADAQAQDLQARAEALARQLAARPGVKAAVMAEAAKPVPKVLPSAPAPKPVKAAEAKPRALPAKADAKGEARPVKAAAKDAIPALRMSANAY
jgi:Flp pilus assembly protein TadD